MSDLRGEWRDHLDDLAARGLRRHLRRIDSAQGAHVIIDGRRLLCFCSNNYLGLANHPRVLAAARDALDRWGWGAGASRLVSGHMGPHAELEARLASFKRTEAALVFPTGYQANLAAVRTLAGPGDVVFSDKLNHASLIDAARGSGAELRIFPHRDYDKLEQLLERYTWHGHQGGGHPACQACETHAPPSHRAQRRVIVTDSIFSMDGDAADLPRLVDLKRKYDAALCIDEAHACGIFGPRGSGLAELMGVEGDIDAIVGTLSKAFGGIGGFVAGSRELIDMLINTAGGFIYTTALPPPACAAAMAALDIIESPEGEDRRRRVLAYAARVRGTLASIQRSARADCVPLLCQQWDPKHCSQSSGTPQNDDLASTEHSVLSTQHSSIRQANGVPPSPIIPLVVGEAGAAVQLSQKLEAEGLLIPAIRPPTVPRGSARLRISLSADHQPGHIDQLLAILGKNLALRR